MPRDLLDPYVAAVADALKAAGVPVTETWTEPVIPVDHCIAVAVGPRGVMHLVWEDSVRGWRFFIYAPRVGTGLPEAGPLPGCDGRPDTAVVVEATRDLLSRLVGVVS